MVPQQPLRRRSGTLSLWHVATLLLLIVVIIALAGCTMLPHGPVVEDRRYEGRTDGLVEVIRDEAFGRGLYFFTDSTLTAVDASQTNIFGGSSHFTAGAVTVVVSTNLPKAIEAGGTAGGIIVKSAIEGAKALP